MAFTAGTFYLSTSILVTILVALAVGYLYINEAKNTIVESQKLTTENHDIITDFFRTYNRTIIPIVLKINDQSGQLNTLLNLAIDNQHLILANLNQSAQNGNTTVAVFRALIEKEIEQGNKTLTNQQYFRGLHEFNARGIANLTHTVPPIR